MRSNHHELKFLSVEKQHNSRNNYLSANNKSPFKIIEKSPEFSRYQVNKNRIIKHRHTHTEENSSEPPKYPFKYIPQLVPKSISPIAMSKNKISK